MKKIIGLFLIALAIGITASAQSTLTLKIQHQGTPLQDANITIRTIRYNGTTDTAGILRVNNLAKKIYTIDISHASMVAYSQKFSMPAKDTSVVIEMEEDEEEEEEVIVQSTRTGRSIRNVPTRVETIDEEEIDEKANMRPSNVSMILHESTGIQVQQTSATSANASIRIQGLDGRYTQLLKDGFASFGNFASGLSVLEIPPLDLQQVEIIKGPASTLYGGGAIAGVVNFISRSPTMEPLHHFIINQSNVGQTNIGGFSAARNNKMGYTMLAAFNKQKAYDVDRDDFTELPRSDDVTIHPRLFIYPDSSWQIILGNSFTKGNRTGGDVQFIENKGDAFHTYFERNKTLRNTSTLDVRKRLVNNGQLQLKQSFAYFDRTIAIPAYTFAGSNTNSFTDLSWVSRTSKHILVTGTSLVIDNFKERNTNDRRDNKALNAGVYLQDTWDLSDKLKLESGLRGEYAHYSNMNYSNSEFFLLPRASLLINFSSKIASRLGGGLGYKTPSLFTELTENIQYRGVGQLDDVRSERSLGFTGDFNYRTRINDLDLALNQLFFYSSIRHPLVLMNPAFNQYYFINEKKPITSKGAETNLKLTYKKVFKLLAGYTFTDAHAGYQQGNNFLALVPKHKLNSALIYEKEAFLKVGLEAYYTSKQLLYDRDRTPSFWEFGFMAEKYFNKISVFVNFENFTDVRQGRYKTVVNPPHQMPTFDDIWTHTEGFTFNGGIKIRL